MRDAINEMRKENGETNIRSNSVYEKIFVMGSEPSPELTADIAEKAITEVKTESELADLFAVIENKAWWIEDEEYDYDEGTVEYNQARKKTDLWFSLADKLRDKIFVILRAEGIQIPGKGQITVLEPFMKGNGYINGRGWWTKK